MIVFTKHAKDRMEERKISEKDIEKVLENPDYIQRESHRIIARRKINREIIEVIYLIEDNKKIILTCYSLI